MADDIKTQVAQSTERLRAELDELQKAFEAEALARLKRACDYRDHAIIFKHVCRLRTDADYRDGHHGQLWYERAQAAMERQKENLKEGRKRTVTLINQRRAAQ